MRSLLPRKQLLVVPHLSYLKLLLLSKPNSELEKLLANHVLVRTIKTQFKVDTLKLKLNSFGL